MPAGLRDEHSNLASLQRRVLHCCVYTPIAIIALFSRARVFRSHINLTTNPSQKQSSGLKIVDPLNIACIQRWATQGRYKRCRRLDVRVPCRSHVGQEVASSAIKIFVGRAPNNLHDEVKMR